MEYSTYDVIEPAVSNNLTTLTNLKLALQLDDSQDTLLPTVITYCSEAIGFYLGRTRDETGNVSLGVQTISETFYDLCSVRQIQLSKRPIVSVETVYDGMQTIKRLVTASDGAMTAGSDVFAPTSGFYGAPFTANFVDQEITIVGAGEDGADLVTTVASVVDNNTLQLSVAASTTVTNASWTTDNPNWSFVARKQLGQLFKISNGYREYMYGNPLTVTYKAGWVLPDDETNRTLPQTLEHACILFARSKMDQLQLGEDLTGPLQKVGIDGIGSFDFGGENNLSSGYGIPTEVRALLDGFRQYTIA
ncbi:MAG: hypothetical protein AAF720_00870 [Pseudomonadota bacterium]